MPWNTTAASLNPIPDKWIVTAPLEGSFFRISQTYADYPIENYTALIAQAEINEQGLLILYEPQNFQASKEIKLIHLAKPASITNRRIAIKANSLEEWIKPYWQWVLSIEAWIDEATTPTTPSNPNKKTYTLIAANYTAQDGNNLKLDSSAGSFTLSLPATPAANDAIEAITLSGTNAIALNLQGNKINGIAPEIAKINKAFSKFSFIYDSAQNGWVHLENTVQLIYLISANLQRLFKLDEGSGQTINDTSGNQGHGNLGGNATVEATDPVWATEGLNFVSNDYAVIPGLTLTNGYSLILVVNPSSLSNVGAFRMGNGLADNQSFMECYQSQGNFYVTHNRSTGMSFVQCPTLVANTWQVIGIINDGSLTTPTTSVYANKSKVASATIGKPTTTTNLWLGIGYSSYYWVGKIAAVALYNRAITEAEYLQMYDYFKQTLTSRGINLA